MIIKKAHLTKRQDNISAVREHQRACNDVQKVYLIQVEEELELFRRFTLVTGAESSLRKRRRAQE